MAVLNPVGACPERRVSAVTYKINAVDPSSGRRPCLPFRSS